MLSNHKGESVLDRSAVESEAIEENSHDHHTTASNDTHLSKRERFNGKVKSLLHIHNDHMNIAGNEASVTLAASPDAIAADARLDEGALPGPGPQGFKQLVQHPVDTIKAKTERKTNKELANNLLSPEITHAQDVELIRAQDTLDNADSEREKIQACGDLETLKKARQDLFVRWTMDRHVSKLQRLESDEKRDRRHREHSRQRDTEKHVAGWIDYSQEVSGLHCHLAVALQLMVLCNTIAVNSTSRKIRRPVYWLLL